MLPLVQRTATALSNWLQPAFGQSLELRPDLDQLEALSPERDALWARLEKTTFLTPDEKRALIGYGPMPPAPKYNPHHIPGGNGRESGQFTNEDGAQGGGGGGDGSEKPQPAQARRGGGRRPPPQQPPPPPGHNNPPGPIPPILPLPGEEKPRLIDENGQAAPRGFDKLEDLNAFKRNLNDALPGDVSAVMQGSAVERGGAQFRNGGLGKSDFDVSLSNEKLYERASEAFPGRSKSDRVGPLNPDQLKELGINVPNIEQGVGRDVRFMIFRDQIGLYRRGPGYPLVTR